MPEKGWLLQEYVGERLLYALTFNKRILLEDFKLMFSVPIEDEKIIEIATNMGFSVRKKIKKIFNPGKSLIYSRKDKP